MDTFSGEETLSFSILPPISKGANSGKKEFAPFGANSFLQEFTLVLRASSSEKAKRSHKVVLLRKNDVNA